MSDAAPPPWAPPPDAVLWDCSSCGSGFWLTELEAAEGCPTEHPEACPGALSKRGPPPCLVIEEGARVRTAYGLEGVVQRVLVKIRYDGETDPALDAFVDARDVRRLDVRRLDL